MAKLSFKFYPSNRLPADTTAKIQTFISEFPEAPIPETPTNSLLFIPYLDDKIVGYASLTINQKSAELSSLFIAPAHQNQLIGFQLMLNILGTLNKSGCQEISLNCSEELVGFFQQLGFIICQEQKSISANNPGRFYELENPCPGFFLNMLKKTLKTHEIDLQTFKQEHSL